MDSLENGDKAELPEDFINTEIMAKAEAVMEQDRKRVLEQDVRTELVIEQVGRTEGDEQLVGHPVVIAEPKELLGDRSEADIDMEVAERIKRILLKKLENTETVTRLSNKDPENGEASAVHEKPELNFDEAKMRIAKICIETVETLKLLGEAEKTLELLEDSENILSKLQENLKTLKEEKMSTKDNPEEVSQKLEMAINTSAREFEQLNVDDKVQTQSESTLGCESPRSDDPMTTTSLSDPPVREISPESQPTFLRRIRRIRNSMRDHYDAFCFVSTCGLILLCLACCSKSGRN